MDNPASLSAQIYRSTAFQIHLRLVTLETNYFVFARNYGEISQLIKGVQHPDAYDKLWPQDKHEEMMWVLREITRLLHNLVASAKTLVEHTRILINQWYEETEFLTEYQAEVKERFSDHPTVGFVEDLRNYVVHYRLPSTSAHFQVKTDPTTKEQSSSQTIALDKPTLLEWSGWTSKSKGYLKDSNDQIVLEDVIDQYFRDVNEFHRWMRQRLIEIHNDELIWLAETSRRVQEMLKRQQEMHREVNATDAENDSGEV
jgi:hypothetical protein